MRLISPPPLTHTFSLPLFAADLHRLPPFSRPQALLATTFQLPKKDANTHILVSIAEDKMRTEFLESMQQLSELGYSLAGTPGTAEFYSKLGIPIRSLDKPTDESVDKLPTDGVIAWIRDKRIDLVINIPEGTSRTDEVTGGYLMRRAAVDFGCSLLTNLKISTLFVDALYRGKLLPCRSAESWLGTQPQV